MFIQNNSPAHKRCTAKKGIFNKEEGLQKGHIKHNGPLY